MQSSRTRREHITEHLLLRGTELVRMSENRARFVHRPLRHYQALAVVEPDAHPAAVGVHVVVVENLQK